MTVCFLGLFVNRRYHTACSYSGPMVWNSASVTCFLKICYYGRQWDFIWCNDTWIDLRWITYSSPSFCTICCVQAVPSSDACCSTSRIRLIVYQCKTRVGRYLLAVPEGTDHLLEEMEISTSTGLGRKRCNFLGRAVKTYWLCDRNMINFHLYFFLRSVYCTHTFSNFLL